MKGEQTFTRDVNKMHILCVEKRTQILLPTPVAVRFHSHREAKSRESERNEISSALSYPFRFAPCLPPPIPPPINNGIHILFPSNFSARSFLLFCFCSYSFSSVGAMSLICFAFSCFCHLDFCFFFFGHSGEH